ncbi:hypothetical protein NQ318_018653 [Aromia moschata]|uniref:CDAN1-interacting nuclease 1 n=1 Tax=Aromia moschata TaxID=1265417 RepID=A0AAV8ZI63_9CUCU|nr:hypothetical protein NQ318_018653 [Aromia moschata]
MDFHHYKEIVTFIRSHHGLTYDCMKELIKMFPRQSYDTLYSILSHEYQKRMKYNHAKTHINKNKYWDLYQEGVRERDSPGIIVRMSKAFDVAPCLIAKIILTRYFENLGVSEKKSLGQEYEVKLHREAIKLGLAFRDEEHLRKNGYDKTPDCKLDVPVAVDGFIINWIESKALFGSEDAHRDYTKNQYLSYWNRFGPGLVIYWFGYLQTIVEPSDKRFIIRDHLPENITQISTATVSYFGRDEI